MSCTIKERRVWRYQTGIENPCIEEESTTQWEKEQVQKDKQRSTNHTHKTKDWVTRTQLQTGVDGFFIFGVLTPLSAVFQLYHGDQF